MTRQDLAIIQLSPPTPNDSPSVHDALMFDLSGTKYSALIPAIAERKNFGIEKYGVALQPFNGRPQWVDAWQEILDLIIYLKKESMEDPDSDGFTENLEETALNLALMIKTKLEENNV